MKRLHCWLVEFVDIIVSMYINCNIGGRLGYVYMDGLRVTLTVNFSFRLKVWIIVDKWDYNNKKHKAHQMNTAETIPDIPTVWSIIFQRCSRGQKIRCYLLKSRLKLIQQGGHIIEALLGIVSACGEMKKLTE